MFLFGLFRSCFQLHWHFSSRRRYLRPMLFQTRQIRILRGLNQACDPVVHFKHSAFRYWQRPITLVTQHLFVKPGNKRSSTIQKAKESFVYCTTESFFSPTTSFLLKQHFAISDLHFQMSFIVSVVNLSEKHTKMLRICFPACLHFLFIQ